VSLQNRGGAEQVAWAVNFMNSRTRAFRGLGRSGFTLIELLMVIVISLLASALAIPSFIRSYRGAKLRTSARAVVMSHRYARSMAVLKQVNAAILYDSKKGEIEIVTVSSSKSKDRDMFLDARGERTGVKSVDEKTEETAPAGVNSEMIRDLADDVVIDDFEMRDKSIQEDDGIYWVNYFRNGMCDKYTIRLRDKYHKTATIKIDGLSGKAKVKYE